MLAARHALVACILALLVGACVPARQTTPTAPPQPTPAPPPVAAPAAPPKVALLVPLSGRAATIGRDLLDAAQMALFDVGDNDVVLLPRDTAGDPESASLAMREAVAAGAGLVLGPLFATSARALQPVAAETGVPVVTFSNDTTVAGGGVFVLGFRPQEQVERVVRFAHARGLRRLGFVGPQDAYGSVAARAFEAAATRLGARGAVATYAADGDPAAAVSEVARARDGRPDGILIADGGARLVRVAALLEATQDGGLPPRLLGTGRWLDDPAVLAEPSLRGAWVAAVPPALPEAFARRFRATFGREPHPLAALAYDATGFAVLLARSDRSFAADLITDPQGFVGTLGPFRLLRDGTGEHGLAVLELAPGGPVVVDPVREGFGDAVASN
jgi:ABC-type branched-subunit amino acid transport system substrate-binding protein